MKQHYGKPRCQLLSPLQVARSRRQLLVLTAGVVLVLTSLACALIEPDSRSAADQIVILTRLPTLTRTPLPILTPTASSLSPAGAMSADAVDITPTSNPSAGAPTASEETDTPGEVLSASPGSTMRAATVAAVVVTDPSALATNPPSATATELPLPTATETLTPTSTPAEPATATPLPTGWLFSGVRLSPDPYESGLLLHGDVLNNTGTTQKLADITGTFYDNQGQPIVDGSTAAYWPIATVPPGARLPFELVILNLQSAADFDLSVEAEPSADVLRQDFEFSEVNTSSGADDYCLSGKLHNPRGNLQSYVIILAVLYDGQEQVINYSDDYKRLPEGLMVDQTVDFEVCIDPLNQAVARYKLQAWGR